CGDGSGYGAFSGTSTASCPTTDNGSRTVKGKIKDKDGGVTEYTASVTINNVAPSATLSNNGPIVEGGSATITFSSPSDPSTVDTTAGFHYSFACNGSAASLATTYAGAGTSTSTSCSFPDNGSFPVLGRIFDKDNGSNTFTTNVVVNNVAPTITSVTNNGPINEGGSATITVTATDPAGAADPLSYEFDCNNDLSYEIGPQAGNSTSCTFNDNGPKQVNVRVSDGDGGTTVGATTVTVNNVNPTATLTNNGPVDEGSSATI